jgi:transposase-like protein
MSRGWGARTGRPLPEAMALKETRSNSQLERENRELRRANEILKAASAFFARELAEFEALYYHQGIPALLAVSQ